jgi:hypothetical protein
MHVGLVLSVQTSQADTGVNAQLALMAIHTAQVAQIQMNVHAAHVEGMLSVITYLEATDVRVLQDISETHFMIV